MNILKPAAIKEMDSKAYLDSKVLASQDYGNEE